MIVSVSSEKFCFSCVSFHSLLILPYDMYPLPRTHNQYIGMELCEHGDAEVFIKTQRDGLLPTVEAQGFLFQMAFALYAGRAELSLRHFDVKLLNFFVSDASRLVGGGGQGGGGGGNVDEGGPVTLRYGVGGNVVELCLPQDRAYLVSGAWVG